MVSYCVNTSEWNFYCFVNGIISNTTIDEIRLSTDAIGIGTTEWDMYNQDTIYVEEFFVCMIRFYILGNFKPPEQALCDQYYVTDTPQLVPIHMLEPARIGTPIQSKIPFSKAIGPHNLFDTVLSSTGNYGFLPNNRYNIFSDGTITYSIQEDFYQG